MIPPRRSIRAYRPDPIPAETLTAIFADAQGAPSWCNVQPWNVALTSPPTTQALATALQTAAKSGLPQPDLAFLLDYPSPYRERRVGCGVALYKAMGVAKGDGPGRYDAWLRNYALFDAPHCAIISCDRRLGPYAYVDVGVWLGYVLVAAAARGVDTCPMASVAAYPKVLREQLAIVDTDVILFALALGYRAEDSDKHAAANACQTTREPVEANVRML